MYIDVVPNRNSPPAILLRESVRCGNKVGKRTIANISHWRRERIEAVRRALKGEFDNPTNGESVSGPVFGLLFALKSVAEQLALRRPWAANGRASWVCFWCWPAWPIRDRVCRRCVGPATTRSRRSWGRRISAKMTCTRRWRIWPNGRIRLSGSSTGSGLNRQRWPRSCFSTM